MTLLTSPAPGTMVIRLGDSGTGAVANPEQFVYLVAGRWVICDRVVDEMSPFRCQEELPEPAEERLPEAGALSVPVFRGQGWVGGSLRHVDCSRDDAGYRLEVEGAAALRISREGRRIVRVRPAESEDAELTHQALLGPALCLALALQGTFCLHAAAVSAGAAAVALLSDSGGGKSTLSRRLAEAPRSGWRRVADDVLPIALTDRAPVILPHFPQLKLAAGEQWGAVEPRAMPLAGLYVLDLVAPESPLEVEPLSSRRGALAVIRHTVAARLFDAELRSSHLDFSVALAARTSVHRLQLPRGSGLPEGLVSTLRADPDRSLQA